jgi:hypothetical protein
MLDVFWFIVISAVIVGQVVTPFALIWAIAKVINFAAGERR